MDEKLMKKQLRAALVFFIILSSLMIVVGSCLTLYLNNNLIRETQDLIKAETDEYIGRLRQSIDSDIQMLDTLGGIIQECDAITDENISQILERATSDTDYNTLLYFDVSGNGISVSSSGRKRKGLLLTAAQKETKSVYQKAMAGEYGISQPFLNYNTNEMELAYGVPIKDKGGQTAGVLMGLNDFQIFTDLLEAENILGGSGYMHLVDSKGNYLVFSSRSVVPRKIQSLFDGPYFQKEDPKAMARAMEDQEPIVFSFRYEKVNYRCLLEPVGVNDWYLFCINNCRISKRAFYQMVLIVIAVFGLIVTFEIILSTYGYRMFKKHLDQLFQVAYMDPVTGIYNWDGFLKKSKELVATATDYSIAALNIRQFKYINEMFGEDQANQLLRYVASVISKYLREDEFVCRDSADVFFLFLADHKKPEVSRRLRSLIDDIYSKANVNNSFQLRIYCGCVIFEGGVHSDFNKILSQVLFTMEKAKEHPRDIFFYNDDLYSRLQMENFVESHMEQALENGEFHMFLQPKFDLRDYSLHGAEALVRWITSDGKQIYPDQFIPLFEQNGFCVKLDMYMVECACQQIRTWLDHNIDPIGISVNQTKLLFYEPNYIEDMIALVEKYRIPPNLITLEILEGIAINDLHDINRKIDCLKGIGFRVSMDDFGSGYSSLNVLSKLHIDELKIDREFLREMTADNERRTEKVLKQVVDMTKDIGITTVVEGVETQDQEHLMSKLGCDYGQGFYYSRPISQNQFNEKYMDLPTSA